MTSAEEALTKLSAIVGRSDTLSRRGFLLFGLATGYTSWEGEEQYTRSLSQILAEHQLKTEGEEEGVRKLRATGYDSANRQEFTASLYSVLTDDGLLLSVTEAPKADLEKAIRIKSLVQEPRVSHMWLPPFLLEYLMDRLVKEHPQARINFFVAKRWAKNEELGVIRPHTRRALIYRGHDGEQAYQELALAYGLYLDTIGSSIQGIADLWASTNGIFSVRRIMSPSFIDTFFKTYAHDLIRDAVEIRSTARNTRNSSVSVPMKKKQIRVPDLSPMAVKFSDEFSFEKAPALVQSLEKANFSLYNTILAKGSVLLDSMVVDKQKNAILAISVNSDRIVLIPHSPECTDSLVRFYQLVVETVDRRATCFLLHGRG